MKRKIININEALCTGCGQCANACAEGAIKMVDGKARLVADNYCDGLGACIGECPAGAITVIERDAEVYDERKAMDNILSAGEDAVARHLEHLSSHGQHEYLRQAKEYLREHMAEPETPPSPGCGCQGSAMRDMRDRETSSCCGCGGEAAVSELRQWPVQLHLLNPSAPYFDGADILVAADCVPFALGDFHRRILSGKIVVVFCPKLDNSTQEYTEKLAEIFRLHDIKSVTVAHMTVPCCSGAQRITEAAVALSGRKIPVSEISVSVDGQIIG